MQKILFLIGFIFVFINLQAQDYTLKKTPLEIKKNKALKDEADFLVFQDHFFNAILQKSKEDYVKAIEELESCKQIYPNNIGMLFEFSKNYYLLKEYDNAVFFNLKVLDKKKTVSIYEHLKKIYLAQKEYDKAILTQEKIIELKPSKVSRLIHLYIINNQKDKAKNLFLTLKEKHVIINYESYYKRILFPKKKQNHNTPQKTTISALQKAFQKTKAYPTLKKLLLEEDAQQQYNLLLIDVKQGLSLYPAQPLLYYLQGKSENKLTRYKDAIAVLQLGLDFIIDNKALERQFYLELYQAYTRLGKSIQATKFLEKANALK